MEWSNSISLKLIALYREQECLWNPTHNDYKSKPKRLEAWNEISEALNRDHNEVKKKVESLMTSFRRERQRQKLSYKTASGAEEVYKSTWFAFNSMLFLMDKFADKKTINSEKLNVTNETQDDNEGDEEDYNEEEEDYNEEEEKYEVTTPFRVKLKRNLMESEFSPLCVLNPKPQAEPKFKKVKSYSSMETSDHADENLNRIVNENAYKEDAFDHFGKYIAAQLRRIPLREGVLLQQEIQNSITRSLLNLYTSS